MFSALIVIASIVGKKGKADVEALVERLQQPRQGDQADERRRGGDAPACRGGVETHG